ncbi:cytosine-specific methyltransferase [Tsukamurella sp. PLM1]|nr:cytosine-specific methyltransferase [Tsukamurella sp. PLM1]
MGSYGVKLERSTPLALDRHVDAPDETNFKQWCLKEHAAGRPLAIDLFSGAGGLGLGVEMAGWTVIAAVDNDQKSIETHRANFRGLALNIDMSQRAQVSRIIKSLKGIPVDLIVGGPPCQPFSRAGRSKIKHLVATGTRSPIDERKELWRSFIDVARAVRPRAIIMENVPDMAIGDDLVVIRTIAGILEATGYAVDYRLLDAWHYGVPQHRKRFILQARNDGKNNSWPEQSSVITTVGDAIGDLPNLMGTTGKREMQYDADSSSSIAKILRDGTKPSVVYDHITRPVRSDDREAFELMDSTTLYSDLPERLRRYRADTFDDKYKRLDWHGLSRTITAHIAKDGYWYIHPREHRTLTVRESARIQTFPDKFRFAGTRSDAFRQIGNAVPPFLGAAVASAIAERPGKRELDRVPIIRQALKNRAVQRRRAVWWLYWTSYDAHRSIYSVISGGAPLW